MIPYVNMRLNTPLMNKEKQYIINVAPTFVKLLPILYFPFVIRVSPSGKVFFLFELVTLAAGNLLNIDNVPL